MSETVAVVIPAFNRAHTLKRALDSVFGQTRMPDEVILVDDGSTDHTQELSAQYPELHYLQQPNRGVSAARNLGVKAANSEWVAFLDSDDEWLPQKLEKQMQYCTNQPQFPLIHSDEIWIRNGVRVNQMDKHAKAGGDIFARCLPLCAISPSAAVMRKSLLEELGGFDESLPACEDYDLWLRVCAHNLVAYLDEPLLNKHGGHEDQLSRKHWGMDRFRVQSLDKLLRARILDAEKEVAARATLHQKCAILLQGAHKRENQALIDEIESLLERHNG